MRILAIAWVPSLLLLLGGIAASAVLTYQGAQTARSADHVNVGTPGVLASTTKLGLERRLSLAYLTDPRHDRTVLSAVRRDLDATYSQAIGLAYRTLAEQPTSAQAVKDVPRTLAGLSAMRQKIDSGRAGLLEVVEFYSNAIDAHVATVYVVASMESEPRAAVTMAGLGALLQAGDAYFQADDLALVASAGHGLSPAEYTYYAQALGSQRALLNQARLSLDPSAAKSLDELRKSPAWLRLEAAHNEILRRGPAGGATSRTATGTAVDPLRPPAAQNRIPRPIAASGVATTLPDLPAWDADSLTLVQRLAGLGAAASGRVSALTHAAAQAQIENAAAVAVLLLLLGAVVLVATTRASGRLIDKLRRLREETLLLSQERLPGVVARLRQGEQVDVAAEVTPLDLGEDEIGQVAQAFNQAQETAIAAAVGEAEVRAGLRTVFINIARRSHGIVHRQLELLDKAERSQEDPDQLALLYELDHLTTRARRNAENLIILGGGQAGRQWRNPVPLLQVVRGAISEARDYVRVSLGTLPPVNIVGGSVADITHLIAELVDNATSFSPPASHVEVRGNLVGRGVVLEIEDQGLGIEPGRLEQLSEMLHQPPDFEVMALADEPRLGIFVVAQLAARHGIRVTLVPSPAYGGTKAVVLIPSNLVSTIDLRSLPTVETTTVDPVSLVPAPIAPPTPSGAVPSGLASPDTPLPRRRARSHTEPVAAPSAIPRPEPWTSGRPVGLDPVGLDPVGLDPVGLDPVGLDLVGLHPGPVPTNRSEPAGDDPRPLLPRRTRQTHLVPQLRTPATTEPPPVDPPPTEVDPEVAGRWLTAFQRGTRSAREGREPSEG